MVYYNKYNLNYINIVKNSIIKPVFKIDILDYYENTIGEITQDISKTGGSISINYQQGQRRSCTFTLDNSAKYYNINRADNIFGFNSKFKIFIGLEDINNKDIYWYSQGVYYSVDPSASHSTLSTITVNGVDKFGIFTGALGYNQLEGTYKIPAGSNIKEVIQSILDLDIGNGKKIDPIKLNYDPLLEINDGQSDFILETPYEIKKSPGGYIGDILIELANIIGANIYYDTDGHLTLTKGTIDIFYSNKSSIWDFGDNELEYSNSSISYSTANAINTVKIVSNLNDGTALSADAENRNPLSPTSIDKIGKKTYYEESSSIFNQTQADEYAKRVLLVKSIIQTAINFSSTMIPHLDVDKIITIDDSNFEFNQERFIIQSISIPLDSNSTLSIQASNIASLPYYELRNGGSN